MTYTKSTTYTFECGGEWWEVTEVNTERGYMCVEEMRKNGQEDDHVSFVVDVDGGGQWSFNEGGEWLVQSRGREVADEMLAFFNHFGTP